MKTVCKVAVGTMVGSVAASFPITYIAKFGLDQSVHGALALIFGGVLLLAAIFWFLEG